VSAFDPDAALAEIREGFRLACCAGDGPLAEAFAALDEHLKHGGALPRAWQVPPHDFMVHSHRHTGPGHMGIEHEHPHPHPVQPPQVSDEFREQLAASMDENDELLRRLADS